MAMKKVIIGCLGAVAAVVAIAAVITWFWFFRELPTLDANLSMASEVEPGANIIMTITATNSHRKSVTLDSIDIDDAFLSAFQVVTVDPEPSTTSHVPFAQQRSWSFGKEVPPGGKLAVSFTFRAIAEGHFSGDVDVCNPNQDFKTLLADVVVKQKLPGNSGTTNGK